MLREIKFPTEGIHLYESKHKDGDTVTKHHHASYQILYGLEGNGKIVLGDETTEFNQDCFAFIKPYSEHAIVSNSELTLLVLAFEDSVLEMISQSDWFSNTFGHSFILNMLPFTAVDLRQLLRKMLFEQTRQDELGQWTLKILLYEFLVVVARSIQSSEVNDSNSLRAGRIRKYIDEHYYESLNASDLAARLGISTRHLNNIFKEHFQTTPVQYLTEVRINRAKKMLAETDKDIVSICFEIGYETVPTFYRAFKKVAEVSPRKYREMYQRPFQ